MVLTTVGFYSRLTHNSMLIHFFLVLFRFISESPVYYAFRMAIYSLIETAKANGHEPYRYLRHLFTELPKASSPQEVAALLPFNISPPDIPDP